MGLYSDYYINGTSLQYATAVYTNIEMTDLAPTGLYSNGIISREQTASGLGPATVCPTCSEVFCEENIAIEPTAPSIISLTYKMGSNPGAIKVTIIGVKLTAIGVALRLDSTNLDNTFSSVGDSGITDNVISAPNLSAASFFYPLVFRATCSNWDNGVESVSSSPQVENYSYNPTSGEFMPTGFIQSIILTNRLTTGLPSTVGDLVKYIPNTSLVDAKLVATAFYPCADVGRPMVVVGCSEDLPTANSFSLVGQDTPGEACSELLTPNIHAHGKVRSVVDGQFMNGDYIFSKSGSVYTKLIDGYYRSTGTNFPEASTIYCTFYSTDGIISEVADC
jgi:hypothetical protein